MKGRGESSRFLSIRPRDFRRKVKYVAATAIVSLTGTSIYARRWREEHLKEVQLASTSGLFVVSGPNAVGAIANPAMSPSGEVTNPEAASVRNSKAGLGRKRNLEVLASTVSRAGLMGTSVPGAKSVKAELETIRRWHQQRGFPGGLVLRELNQPLYDMEADSAETMEGGDDVDVIPHEKLNQRECYYLYYEIMGNGEIRQQIFCRGTTLAADVGTCLKGLFVHDDELGCRLHLGFRAHAERLLADVAPLLAPPTNRRATVEICGHSLGGAVAYIVAMKLRKRGYNVVRVTSVGAPRFCEKRAVKHLTSLLPKDSLRIEDDRDPVTYMPPHLASLGDKLWFVSEGGGVESARFVCSKSIDENKWVESVFINCRLPETVAKLDATHRVPNYVTRVQSLAAEMEAKLAGDDTLSVNSLLMETEQNQQN